MGRNRFVQPETVRLDIGDGDWIEVKKRLTSGEARRAYTGIIKNATQDGKFAFDMNVLGRQELLAYLVEWSLIGLDGKRVPIDTEARKEAAVDALDQDDFKTIDDAVTAHIAAMEAERADAKKLRDGANTSSAISPSPEIAAGVMSGSATSTGT